MLDFDFTNVSRDIIGSEQGIDLDYEFSNYAERMSEVISGVYQLQEVVQWFQADYQHNFFKEIKEYADMVRGKFKDIVVIGTGTPIEGIQAMAEALIHPYWNFLSDEQRENMPRIHYFSNIDPETSYNFKDLCDATRTLCIVISKNAAEPETMALFMILKKYFERVIGENYRMHIVTCTTRDSLLYNISNQEGYKCFEIPYEHIGNFAIMSTCGLLPLRLLGINIDQMLLGCQDIVKVAQNTDIRQHKVAQLALINYLFFKNKKKNMSIILSYSAKFQYLSRWCSRYKSEILSKDFDKYGNFISSTQLPAAVHGFNDQNVLMQILIEGDNNKIINMLQVQEAEQDINIPKEFDYTAIGFMGGKTLGRLLNSETEAMRMLLTDRKIPNTTILVPKINSYYIGQYMAMYMLNIAFQAFLMNIDPLVKTTYETLNNYIWALMGRYGYEETLREFNEKLAVSKRQPVLPE